ncbi:dihydrofolate reductase family protein [Streptomyces sp. NPDC058045]|uniref:dihydrofolate reductase family protein n=1 Tax=Streptomyces sp. NPDC058045 TaxID=3346311 RepID=UPI0036EA726A
MGRLIVTEFMTLDGVAQAPGASREDVENGFEYGGWQAPLIDAEAGRLIFEQAEHMDALLLGRRTYDLFADYWPTAPPEMDFTRLINTIPKHVATGTLTDPLGWENAQVLEGDLAKGVAALKERYDRVHVIGSLHLVRSLLAEQLVDQINLWVYPLLLGTGKRVFDGGAPPAALRLANSRTFPNGCLQLEYEWAGEPAFGDMTDPEAAR